MDGARRAKFAVDIRIPALKAVFAHVDVMFHANVAGWPFGVIGTGFQIHTSFFLLNTFSMEQIVQNLLLGRKEETS